MPTDIELGVAVTREERKKVAETIIALVIILIFAIVACAAVNDCRSKSECMLCAFFAFFASTF